MLTIQQIVSQIIQPQVAVINYAKTTKQRVVSDVLDEGDFAYPLINWEYKSTSRNDNIIGRIFTFHFLDLQKINDENSQNIIVDNAEKKANEFIKRLDVFTNDLKINIVVGTINPLYEFNSDYTCGIIFDLEFLQLNNTDVCPMTIADYATFNTDKFLQEFLKTNSKYGYSMTNINIDGFVYADRLPMYFTSVDSQDLPIQSAPMVTIPNYTNNAFKYDDNFFKFINAQNITGLEFIKSPFDGKADSNYPSNSSINSAPYGEAFSILHKQGITFRFTINYYYVDANNVEVIGHEIVYTEANYIIDGGIEYPQNRLYL
jgi:hypothetical protein